MHVLNHREMQKNQNKTLIRTKESKNTIFSLVCYAGMHSVLHIITAYIHNTYIHPHVRKSNRNLHPSDRITQDKLG